MLLDVGVSGGKDPRILYLSSSWIWVVSLKPPLLSYPFRLNGELCGPQIWSGRGVEHIHRYPGGESNPTGRTVVHSITSSLNVNRIKCQTLCGGVLIILFKN